MKNIFRHLIELNSKKGLYLNATKTAQQFKKEAKEWKRLPSELGKFLNK